MDCKNRGFYAQMLMNRSVCRENYSPTLPYVENLYDSDWIARSASPNLIKKPTRMKKFFTLLCIIALIAVSNCSRIPENNDPILGIWARTETMSIEEKEFTEREEWIFNDAYLGRYQIFEDKKLTYYTDFRWTLEEDIYTIEYGGTELPEARVIMQKTDLLETLQLESGDHFATRE
jgi:hypothetical protein